jgi:hypothetical protein
VGGWEYQGGTPGNTREAISVVFPHVQKKMCWEKIICYKGISTRIFCRQQDEINAYRGTTTSICSLDYENVLGIPCLYSLILVLTPRNTPDKKIIVRVGEVADGSPIGGAPQK